jgi:rhodanese-related sulfurtransferase
MHPHPFAFLVLTAIPALAADPPKAASAQLCATCHTPAPGNLLGYLDDVMPKSRALHVKLDGTLQVLRYDRNALKVLAEGNVGTPEAVLNSLKRGQAVRVEYTERKDVKTATLVSAKPATKLAAADLVSMEEIQRLVALGPEAGNYFLFDARPPARFQEGSIPTAVNLPFIDFGRHADKLPADKGALVIFFCYGRTCNMSPCALAKTRSLGYTNAKVYQDGMSAWYAKGYGVVSPASFKEAFLDKGVPTILLDLRPADQVEKGFIKGAVYVPPGGLQDLVAHDFPAAHLRPPILVVDGEGGETAKTAAMELVRAGYTHVNVLTGGFQAWQAASLSVETEPLATRVAYAPRLRAGAIPNEEFTRIASLAPEARKDILILDVRNRFEARSGKIKGALNLPHDELAARLSEIPKDRRILIHCGNGALAEAAYSVLKDKGYEAAYLNAEITIIDTGDFIVD